MFLSCSEGSFLTGLSARIKQTTKTINIISMHTLCHKLRDIHPIFKKTLSILLTFFLIWQFSGAYAQKDSLESEKLSWQSTYDRALVLLEDDKFKESEKLLLGIQENLPNDKEAHSKTYEALAVALCGQAIEKEIEAHRALEQNRNTFLSGIVLVLLAAMILSLFLRYGPEKPKMATELESWVRERKEKTEKGPAFQAGSSIFTLLIFALSAFGLFAVLMIFLWILAFFSPPKDGNYKEAEPFYEQAIGYLNKANRNAGELNKASVLSHYYNFKKAHGVKPEDSDHPEETFESRHGK